MPKKQSIGAEAKPPILSVYQLKVSLRGISPMIWRRLLVSSTTTIAHLHGILQVAMGWEDVHLHRFRVHGKDYGIYREGGIGFVDDPSQVTLADLKLRAHERFVYEYDFGDSWLHDILLEQVLPADPRKTYPVCTAGAGDCPPEDCGGPEGYHDLVESRSSFAAYEEAYEDVLLVAERILVFHEGGPRPTVDEPEFMDALDRMRDRLDAAPIAFDRRAVNTALHHISKEIP
jgi:hypothetical protein